MDPISLMLTVSGWIVGPFLGYYLRRHSQKKNRNERAEQLRQQFITELQEIGEPLNSWPNEPPWEKEENRGYVVPHLDNAAPTKVYDEHITELGILKEDEIEKTRNFYTDLQRVQEMCNTWIEKHPDNFDYEEEPKTLAKVIHSNIGDLKDNHKELLEELEQ